jgi:hypothetical protein
VMAGFARDVQAAGIRGVGPLYTYPELRFGAEVGCDSATKPRFWELAGDSNPNLLFTRQQRIVHGVLAGAVLAAHVR